MDIVEQGLLALTGAEERIEVLLKKGLKQQRFGDVARLAKVAEQVRRILEEAGHKDSDASPPKSEDDSPSRHRRSLAEGTGIEQQRGRSRTTDRYPRFESDGERLVKVGWSKKNKQEYEHKAPLGAVQAFCGELSSIAASGNLLFSMDDVLPVEGSHHDTIPDYQAYLTLAWLRSRGVVEKQGRDGYLIRRPDELDKGLHEAWKDLIQETSQTEGAT